MMGGAEMTVSPMARRGAARRRLRVAQPRQLGAAKGARRLGAARARVRRGGTPADGHPGPAGWRGRGAGVPLEGLARPGVDVGIILPPSFLFCFVSFVCVMST
jgi:hypothetical protein